MLVYGDPQYEQPLSRALAELAERAACAPRDDLDALRSVLIHAGQIEQAVFDFWADPAAVPSQLAQLIPVCTDSAARAFCHCWTPGAAEWPFSPSGAADALRDIANALSGIILAADPILHIKIPEGFEFYGLFPEQYAFSAVKWAKEYGSLSPQAVVIVGIRSIGTSLSALTKVVLQAKGWRAQRFTVRPGGHPFSRTLQLAPSQVFHAPCAIVVDEGPGLSGSSIASVIWALRRAGSRHVSLFPGHSGEPGSAASEEIRRCWNQTPRYFTSLEEVRWSGLNLQATLAKKSGELVDAGSSAKGLLHAISPAVLEDLSGGQWRGGAFSSNADWPPVAPVFERMKLLWRGPRPLLWKFSGLGAVTQGKKTQIELSRDRLRRLASANWTSEPLAAFRGFLALPWVEGRVVRTQDAPVDGLLRRLADYVACSAEVALSVDDIRNGIQRLSQMLFCNAQEALGSEMAESARCAADAALNAGAGLGYGDGRMAPWEWIRAANGRLWKTDAAGHQLDHTLVGRQSVLWDIAGTIVEWELDSREKSEWLACLRRRALDAPPDALKFYCMAFAAFRLGLLNSACGQNGAADEQGRLKAAAARYASRLKKLIQRPARS